MYPKFIAALVNLTRFYVGIYLRLRWLYAVSLLRSA